MQYLLEFTRLQDYIFTEKTYFHFEIIVFNDINLKDKAKFECQEKYIDMIIT